MKQTSRVVVITGASAGIGRAAARAFARDGAKIGLLARGVDGLEAAKEEVENLGGTALVLSADVANAGQVEAAAVRFCSSAKCTSPEATSSFSSKTSAIVRSGCSLRIFVFIEILPVKYVRMIATPAEAPPPDAVPGAL